MSEGRWVSSVEPGEGRTVALLLAHSFAMGLSTVFFETGASALFLARFGPLTLPYVYVAAAVLNTAAGAAYASLQGRVAFPRLMTGTLWALLVSVAALRAGLAVTDAAGLTFLLLVWYRAISILTDLEYWAVAGRLFDVRQAKRLFPLIGSGEVVARIAGAFAVPLLVELIGVPNLLVLSGAALLACAILASAVLRGASFAEAVPSGGPQVPRPSLRLLATHPYVATLVGLAALAVLAKYLVDFAFLEQMRSRYEGARDLATFFAVFSGASQVMSLLTRVLVAGPLLERHGVRAGLLILPLAHVACTALVVAGGLVPSMAAAVFWLVIANQGIYKTLKHPIDNPSFKVLYQPLRKEDRLATQVMVETLVTPVTIGVAGLLMLAFSTLVAYDPTVFAWAMLAAFAAWVALAVRAGRRYASALMEALRGRIVDDAPFVYGDARSLAVLHETLASERPGDVLFALDLLDKAQHRDLDPVLAKLLDHPVADVRRSALERLQRRGTAGARDAVAARVAQEPVPSVRAAALRCLAVLGGPAAWPTLMRALEEKDPEIRRGALIGLLRTGAAGAYQSLVDLAGSAAAAERAAAARVIGEVATGAFHAPLAWLLEDKSPEVRRAALQAAGRVAQSDLWPAVARSLGDPRFGTAAVAALSAGGEAALAEVERVFKDGGSRATLQDAARVCGRIKSPAAVAVMKGHIGFADEQVRTEVLEALFAAAWSVGDDERDTIEERIRGEVTDAAWTLAAMRDLAAEDEPALRVLHGALSAEVRGARRRVLLLLALLHGREAVLRVAEALDHGTREKRAYALEMLDVLAGGSLRGFVLPLFEGSVADRESLGRELLPEPTSARERVRETLARDDAFVLPWTRTCALHAAATLPLPEAREEVARHLGGSAVEIVRETAAWALGRLDGTEVERGRGGRMLAIEKVICLKAVPMFAEASEEILADVAAILEDRTAAAGEVVFRKGDAGDGMYIIVHGRVRVFDEARTITHLGEHDIFGELALLDPEPRLASIEAVEETRLFRLDREAFGELMAANIEIVRGVLHVLCERLRHQAQVAPAWPSDGSAGRAAPVAPAATPGQG